VVKSRNLPILHLTVDILRQTWMDMRSWNADLHFECWV